MNYFIEVTFPFLLSALGSIYLFFRLFKQFTGKQLFKIASPCSLHWSELKGNSKVRFCDLCQKKVHNVCKTSKAERKVLLDKIEKGENVCIYLEPPLFRQVGYFTFALIMSALTITGYKELRRKSDSGILGGIRISDQKFSDFGTMNK